MGREDPSCLTGSQPIVIYIAGVSSGPLGSQRAESRPVRETYRHTHQAPDSQGHRQRERKNEREKKRESEMQQHRPPKKGELANLVVENLN